MPSKKQETTQEPIETIVGPQLASAKDFTADGRNDERKLSNISPVEAIAYSWFLAIPDHEGGEWARDFVNNMLTLRDSVEGWRSNQLIRLVAGSKGVPSTDYVKKPGIIARNLTKRDWEQKAKVEGKEIVE